MQLVDHMVVDARQNVSQIGLRIKAREFGGFYDGHGLGERFASGVAAREEPVLASDAETPFILPVSGRSWKSITDGTHILVVRSPYAALSSERQANFLRCRGRLG
jgi:hypothetical protein